MNRWLGGWTDKLDPIDAIDTIDTIGKTEDKWDR